MEDNFYQKTIDWYNQNAGFYVENSNKNTLIDRQQLDDFANYLVEGGKVLDAGCGSGRDSNIFLSLGFDVIGIDISKNLIEEAKKRYPKVDFKSGDIINLSFENNTFNGVWAHASVVHFQNKEQNEKAFSELTRVLKKGGILHLLSSAQKDKKTEVRPDTISGSFGRFYYNFEKQELTNMLVENGLNILKCEQYNESDIDPNKRPGEGIEWILVLAKK